MKLPSTFKPSSPKLRFWLNGLLVILLSYTLAQLTWQLVSGPVVSAFVAPLAKDASYSVDASIPDVDSVASLHLLGDSEATPKLAKAELDAPKTRLNLVLKGVFAGESQDEAVAIIARGGRDEKSYRRGDTIAGAARVHRILSNRVILDRNGQFETLFLPRETLGVNGSNTSRGVVPVNGRSPQQAGVRQLSGVRKMLQNDPQRAMRLLRAEPVMAGEELKGYRLRPGDDRALFARAGLRPGDIVTAVNGVPLSEQGEMMGIFQQLKSSGRAVLMVERGGRTLTLPLKLD